MARSVLALHAGSQNGLKLSCLSNKLILPMVSAGQIIWACTRRAQTKMSQLFLPAIAHLQGVLLGLHVAKSLGIPNVKLNMPTPDLLKQVISQA